jgi:hypothetical protein
MDQSTQHTLQHARVFLPCIAGDGADGGNACHWRSALQLKLQLLGFSPMHDAAADADEGIVQGLWGSLTPT